MYFWLRKFYSLDCGEQVLVLTEDVLQESLLKLCDLAGLHFVQVTPDTSVDDSYLLLNGHGSWGERVWTGVTVYTQCQEKK